MALLTLIRHGQASFMAANYDKLSTLGEAQSRHLGEYWVRLKTTFDQIYYGPAERQIRTGEIASEVCRRAGLPWPAPIAIPEMDEYSGIEVMRTFLPRLMEKHQDIREMESQFRDASDKGAAARVYDHLFQRVTRMWVAGELDASELEPWDSFCNRIESGISKIRQNAGKNARIAVFTSGGVIAATARYALDLSQQKTLELSWTSRNATYSEFLFSGDRFSLSTFNNMPHLEDPNLITWR